MLRPAGTDGLRRRFLQGRGETPRPRMRSAGLRKTLRLDVASPSGSRTIGAPTNVDIEIQVEHHLPDAGQLLGVLLTEAGQPRVDDMEQLEHHGQHPVEVTRPRRPLEHSAERSEAETVTCRSSR